MIAALLAFALQASAPLSMPPPPPLPPRSLPTVTLPLEPGHAIAAAFVVIDDRGYVRFSRDGDVVGLIEISSTGGALSILVDRRFEVFWTPLLAWAGPDLRHLRDASLRRAEDSYRNGIPGDMARSTTQSMVRPMIRRALQYADALSYAGQQPAAEALLERERGAIDRSTEWGLAEWSMLTVRLSGMAATAGHLDQAIAILRAASAATSEANAYAINFDVNGAAYLAEFGDYQTALTLVDGALARFNGKHGKGVRVDGSDRQFGWIRACALHGLGREAEARRALAPVLRDREPSQGPFVLTPNTSLRFRAFACMSDSANAAAALAEEFAEAGLAPSALRSLQPGYWRSWISADFRKKVAAEPAIVPFLTARMNVLPESLVPALNGWAARDH